MNTNLQRLKHALSQLRPAELAELGAQLQRDWQIDPAPIAKLPPPTPPPRTPSRVAVWAIAAGPTRVPVIRALRQLRPDLQLAQARDLLRQLPAPLSDALEPDEAEAFAAVLREAGAEIEVRPTDDE